MFISASMRTDIANYYSEWLMNRIRDGYALSRNPFFPNQVYRCKLTPDVVDCIVLCTKNPEPMLDRIDEIRSKGFHLFFFVTITCYGKDIEPHVPDYHHMMDVFQTLSHIVGRHSICWRYDPILITDRYTTAYHLQCFEEMAGTLSPYTDRCIFSFVQLYQKLAVTFPELRAVSESEKQILLSKMSDTAAKYKLLLQTCGDGHDYADYGIAPSGCISIPVMERALGRELKVRKAKPARRGCGCLPAHDIGAYHTCPNGCRYCYANRDARSAAYHRLRHDPCSPLLTGRLHPEDVVVDAEQISFLQPFQQLSLPFLPHSR